MKRSHYPEMAGLGVMSEGETEVGTSALTSRALPNYNSRVILLSDLPAIIR